MARGLIEILKEDLLNAGVPLEVVELIFGQNRRQCQDNISRVTAEIRSVFKAIALQFLAAPKQELGQFLGLLMDVSRDLGLDDAQRVAGKLHSDKSTWTGQDEGLPTLAELVPRASYCYKGKDKRKGQPNNVGTQTMSEGEEESRDDEDDGDAGDGGAGEAGPSGVSAPASPEATGSASPARGEKPASPSAGVEKSEELPPLDDEAGAQDPDRDDPVDEAPRCKRRKSEEPEEEGGQDPDEGTLTSIEVNMLPLMYPEASLALMTPADRRKVAQKMLEVSRKYKKCEYLYFKMSNNVSFSISERCQEVVLSCIGYYENVILFVMYLCPISFMSCLYPFCRAK